jgi:topoisomerase-4 subunit A
VRHRARSKTGDDKPHFLGVRDILKASVDATKALLKRELEIKLGELEQQWHWDSLERIFIEERIYRNIEKSKTWESVLDEIRKGPEALRPAAPPRGHDEDIVRLTEIRIKRISAYNRFQAEEAMKKIEAGHQGDEVEPQEPHRVRRRVVRDAPGKIRQGIKRRTSYDEIEQIDASAVVSANQRLYVNRKDGFIGLNWRQHEFVTECTILDSVLAIMKDGSLKVAKVGDKVFMGRDIIHVAIWPKEGDTNFYTMVYQDGESGKAFAKKFQIGGLSRDKLYPLVNPRTSRVVYLHISARRKRCPKTIHVSLDGRSGARVRELDFDLTRVPVSTRTSKGLTVTKWPVKDVKENEEARRTQLDRYLVEYDVPVTR